MLAIGGILFWALIALVIISVIYSIETEGVTEFFWPFAWIVAFFGGSYFLWRQEFMNVFNSINWTGLIIGSVIYLIIGVMWVFFKWNKLAKKKYKDYLFAKVNYPNSINSMTEFIPKVEDHKADISVWIVLFPFSMLRYITNDLFGDLLNKIRESITGTLNRISASHFKEPTL